MVDGIMFDGGDKWASSMEDALLLRHDYGGCVVL